MSMVPFALCAKGPKTPSLGQSVTSRSPSWTIPYPDRRHSWRSLSCRLRIKQRWDGGRADSECCEAGVLWHCTNSQEELYAKLLAAQVGLEVLERRVRDLEAGGWRTFSAIPPFVMSCRLAIGPGSRESTSTQKLRGRAAIVTAPARTRQRVLWRVSLPRVQRNVKLLLCTTQAAAQCVSRVKGRTLNEYATRRNGLYLYNISTSQGGGGSFQR